MLSIYILMSHTALVKAKMFKQESDVTTYTTVNSLESNIYKDGLTLNVAGVISNTTIKNITVIISENAPITGYWIDESDGNRLKLSDGSLVTGSFRLVAQDLPTSNMSWTSIDKAYNIINGLPKSYLEAGNYIDLTNSKISTVVGLLGTVSNTENGVYYRVTGNKIWKVDGGSGFASVNLINDTYLLNAPTIPSIDTRICDTINGVIKSYDGKFINRSNNHYYDNQQYIGDVKIGSVFFCDDKILIRTNSGYKKTDLVSI